jgi:hypothetical protein
MSKKDKKNGIKNGVGEVENGKKSPSERNERGQFVNSPGPGRGQKKEEQVELDGELFDDIERVIRKGMASKDVSLRLKAAGLGVRLESLKKRDDSKEPVIPPWLDVWLSLLNKLSFARLHKTGIPTSGMDIMGLMSQTCVNCDRLGTTSIDPDFKEVEDDDPDDNS